MDVIAEKKPVFDSLIVGGGPAGLAAAVYIGRALRSAVVFDSQESGRSDWVQHNYNFLGFPEGIPVRDLILKGRAQASRYGVSFEDKKVSKISRRKDGLFSLKSGSRTFTGRSVVLATGVTDRWVQFPQYEDCIGRSLHWCLVCDGYEMQGKHVLVAGDGADAAETALQLTHFTDSVSLLLDTNPPGLSPDAGNRLKSRKVGVYYGQIVSASFRDLGEITSVLTNQGDRLFADHVFSAFGSVPNSELAKMLNLKLDADDHIVVDSEARTSLPGVFAAGDVSRLFSHQLITAAHEGSTAAMAIAHDLFEEDLQRG